MPSQSNPKRTAASEDATPPPTKKTRFVDPSEDPVNFAEQVDSALENRATRRGGVKTDGYDSESTDGEDADGGKDGDDNDDMFADPEQGERTQGKKKTEYLRLGDIEGQEFGADGSGDDDSSDEPEDEDDAERRKKKGMGYEMSSFNMREEMEEGKFTEDGSYVRSFDPHSMHDRWMEGLSEREIKAARKRKKEHDRVQEERLRAEEQEIQDNGGLVALQQELLSKLKRGETVLEALQRLGTSSNKKKQKSQSQAVAGRSEIEHITHLASNIMSLGETDIYSKTFEELVRAVRSSGRVDDSWQPPSADKKFEYKWAIQDTNASGEIFGPFGEEEMSAWFKALYFGSAGEKVLVREVGSDWATWGDLFP